ncbi:MAG: iron-containing alcohol dehydrogenase [Verrucomicrobiota bacterium]
MTGMLHSANAPTPLHDFSLKTRLLFGHRSADRVGELAREYGAQKVLLVTDAGVTQAGHAARVEQTLRAAGLHVTVFNQVRENPTVTDVALCSQAAREAQPDCFIGLGGGSVLDVTKAANLLLTNGGEIKDFCGSNKVAHPLRPWIAIPTTTGTGSECQSSLILVDESARCKLICRDPKLIAPTALLDPTLASSQPPRVTAATGMNAIAQAVESAVSRKRNPLAQLFAREAFRLCYGNLLKTMTFPDDLEARGQMLLGATYAGLAAECGGLGAAHAAAYPLETNCNVLHGVATGVMLSAVIRFNAQQALARSIYTDLARLAMLDTPEALSEALERLLADAKLPRSLSACGVPHKMIPGLTDEAVKQWAVPFNPRPVNTSDFSKLYNAVF